MVGISSIVDGCDRFNARAAVVGHIFWAHRQVGGCWVRLPEILDEPKIITEQGIKLDVHSEARPIVGVDELVIWAVDDIDIPAHQAHLQTKNCRIAAVVRKDELDCITVRNPNKALPEDIMPDLVNPIIACKALAKMRV